MLSGGYQHSLDNKGRVFFPTRLKEEMGEEIVLCRGVEKCLMAFSKQGWADFADRMKTLPFSTGRDMQRFFFSTAAECSVDKQGRLLIPQNLREYAGLKDDVMLTGVQTRVEIWDLSEWQNYADNLAPSGIIAKMDEIGF